MSTDVVIPSDLWEDDDQETAVSSWLVDDGAEVEEGSIIAEIMTEKTQHEITAPASGTVEIVQAVEEPCKKGDVIARIK